ncbi:uncharacterized protein LOC132888139 isoform X2 [Neoarius graeffei]|uniref:uncharacterized protein LOC132888139 isoform X2 n=1 Tax=Neoarius graeffei TaxID=443677 RepID=UPI00298C344A|nr:uncharacterized protein LOC132888139 isoform X2 [Neoarius graeffei]
MAASNTFLSEEQLQCSICLEIFIKPVTTSCGHNYCMLCLNKYWDNSQKYSCPFCKEEFSKRPELFVNTLISNLAAQFKESVKAQSSTRTKTTNAAQGNVPCDVCADPTQKALKSCLDCGVSFCDTHLDHHKISAKLKQHKLINAVKNLEDYICQRHQKPLEMFCRNDQKCVCLFCTEGEHKSHNTIPMEEEIADKKNKMRKTQADVQEMIQDKRKKIEEIKRSVVLKKAYFTLSTPPSTDTWDQIIINSSLNVKDMVKDLLHLQESINNIAEKMPGAKRHATSISACMYPAVPLDCQKEEIGRLLKTPLQKGDTWYLVDSSWFKTWKKYVGFDSWDMLGYQTCHPGPVDNSGLLTDSLSLKEHLIEDLDYILLPKEAWGKLISWYGLTEHQKPIARKVVEQGMFLKHCKVEVYLTEVRLCEFSNVDQSIRRQFSKVDTVACIEKEMHKIFNIPDGKKTRLWLKYISNTYAHLSNPGSSVQDAGIYHGQVVLVEQINNNGTWPRDAVPPPCQKSQKRNT